MAYEVITINTNNYNSYASVAEADIFLGASLNTVAWSAADTDGKGKLLVSATRLIDAQTFLSVAPDNVLRDATSSLANAFANDPTLALGTGPATPSRSVKAGSVEVTNFRPDFLLALSPFPADVLAMLRPYLASQVAVGGAFSNDTANDSEFEDCDRPTFTAGM